MKRLLFLFLFMTLCHGFQAQSYSYSFIGNLHQDDEKRITDQVKNLPTVLSVEVRNKVDQEKGELLFSIDPLTDRGENDHPFSPADIKVILISFGLQPIEFHQFK